MHPVLFRIPLPDWNVPLFPALLVLAGLGAALLAFAWARRATDLVAVGGLLAIGGAVAAFRLRGDTWQLESLPIYSYGAMLCLSLVVGWYLTLGLGERAGIRRDWLANWYFVSVVGALFAARLLYVVTNLDEFQSLADLINFRRGGLVAYGGFLGGFVAGVWYLRKRGLPVPALADVCAPALAAGLTLTRIGCYLFGCDYGEPLGDGAPGWLAKLGTFPRWSDSVLEAGSGSPAWVEHVSRHDLPLSATESLPVHPTQLYEVLVGASLVGLTLWLRKRQSFRGEVFLSFVFGYGVLRFVLELWRADPERGAYGPHLAEHWWVALVLALLGGAFAFGPARSVPEGTPRKLAMGAGALPAIVAFVLLKPGQLEVAEQVQLSTSQWIGALSALAAALYWGRWAREAERDPEGAMRLELGAGAADAIEPEPESAGPDDSSGDSPEERPARRATPAKKKSNRKRKKGSRQPEPAR